MDTVTYVNSEHINNIHTINLTENETNILSLYLYFDENLQEIILNIAKKKLVIP